MAIAITLGIGKGALDALKADVKAARKELAALDKETEKQNKQGRRLAEGVSEQGRRGSQNLRAKYLAAQGRVNEAQAALAGGMAEADRRAAEEGRHSTAPGARAGGAGTWLESAAKGKTMLDVGVGYLGTAAGIATDAAALFDPYSEAIRTRQAGYRARSQAATMGAEQRLQASADEALAVSREGGAGRALEAIESKAATLGGAVGALGGPVGMMIGAAVGKAVGMLAGGINDYRTLELRRESAEKRVIEAARAMGGVDRKQMERDTALAEDRYFANKIGSNIGGKVLHTLADVKALATGKDYEAIANSVAGMYARFTQQRNEGDSRALSMDFAGADASYAEAEKERPGALGWRNPLAIWVANDQASQFAARFAATQNPLPALREGY